MRGFSNTTAKVMQQGLLSRVRAERSGRALGVVARRDLEGFGGCFLPGRPAGADLDRPHLEDEPRQCGGDGDEEQAKEWTGAV
jgi:hypothetical protein